MNHLLRLIENTEQMPELARGLLREAVRGPERLAAYATSEGYPVSVEDIMTALYGSREARPRARPRDNGFDLADDAGTRTARVPLGICPMLGLFRWYHRTVA